MGHLVRDGWAILRVADTASREAGRDIEAQRGAERLWVTVKGFPESTERTNASTQARTWFAGAILDAIVWREENASVRIAIALPKKPTFQNLADRTTWLEKVAGISYLWVTENGVEKS